MNTVLRRVKINDPRSKHHGQRLDILIKDGKVERIAHEVSLPSEDAKLHNCEKLTVSPGWMDIGVYSGEPGYEHREDLESLSRAGLAGGYTDIAIWPETDPYLDQAMTVQSIHQNTAAQGPCHIHAIASPVRKHDTALMSEMMEIEKVQAVGFGMGLSVIDDMNTLLRVLEYMKSTPKLSLFICPAIPRLIPGGQMHEGPQQAHLGIRGIPAEEEKIRISQSKSLAQYADSPVVLHGISSAESLQLLTTVKDNTLIKTGVAVMNLCYSDVDLQYFDSAFKVLPPLRSSSDRQALVDAVLHGDIDYVFSNHKPLEEELKNIEFGQAEFGAAAIDIAFPLLNTAVGDRLSDERLVEILSLNPRRMTGLEVDIIEEGAAANLTLYDRDTEQSSEEIDFLSKSKNYPRLPKILKGKVHACLHGSQIHGINP